MSPHNLFPKIYTYLVSQNLHNSMSPKSNFNYFPQLNLKFLSVANIFLPRFDSFHFHFIFEFEFNFFKFCINKIVPNFLVVPKFPPSGGGTPMKLLYVEEIHRVQKEVNANFSQDWSSSLGEEPGQTDKQTDRQTYFSVLYI